jgi:hypothetical protein
MLPVRISAHRHLAGSDIEVYSPEAAWQAALPAFPASRRANGIAVKGGLKAWAHRGIFSPD